MNEKETEQEQHRQIKKLLAASTATEKRRIKRGLCAGRRLRAELERLI